MFTPISACRICDNPVVPLFTIPAPKVSGFPTPDRLGSVLSVPLSVVRCVHCEHVQLLHTVDPSILYQEYWYESGINERMRSELADVVNQATLRGQLQPGDHVLDIGANDGTLLDWYGQDVFKVAIEPSDTFQQTLRQKASLTLQGTFPEIAPKLPPVLFKAITTIAMFYDLHQPVVAAEEIRRILHPYGVWICQFQDLEQQVRAGAWDNVVHEHVSYFTLGTFNEVVRRAGLQIVDVEHSTINGGSLRVYVGHSGSVWHVTPNVQQQYFNEYRTLDHYWPSRFARRMAQNIGQIRSMVECVVEQGGLVDLYGASTKGNTLLQVCNLGDKIRVAWERNPRKVGRCTVTGVPIVDEELGRAVPPDALLATIWQFADQIIARERETLKTVRMILPLPEATWIDLYREEKRA